MLKVIQTDKAYEVDFETGSDSKGTVNGEPFDLDVLQVRDRVFHILHENQSYNAEIVSLNQAEKTFKIRINGRSFEFQVKDHMDLLLEQMGLSNLATQQVSEVKAPMPGLVLDVSVSPGQEVAKGEPLLVLEAMKMENVIKSPAAGVVADIPAIKGQAVEKGVVLIRFA